MTIEDARAKARKVIQGISESSFVEEEDLEGERVKITCLGTVFNLYPSGKYYTPWANSNVTPCPRCKGAGKIKNKKADSSNQKIAWEQANRLRKTLMEAYGLYGEGRWPKDQIYMLEKLDEKERLLAPEIECKFCGGTGSREAYEDDIFSEVLEEAAHKRGGFIFSGEGDPCDIFYGENVNEVVVEDKQIPDDEVEEEQ